MNVLDFIQPIVLRYHEKGWTEATVKCLLDAGFEESDIVFADRQGVGNMSKAFNTAFFNTLKKIEGSESTFPYAHGKPFTWFLTNVSFPEQMPASLLDVIQSDNIIAAVHPAFDSDHPHIRNAYGINREVPFIEWTAPLVRSDVFLECAWLDDKMPYWGMDLDWSHIIQEKCGKTLAVDGRHRLGHTYLRFNEAKEAVTIERTELRKTFDASTEQRLVEKYGADWMAKLWPTHPHVLQGKKNIHA
jgi:hypothetical protein